MKIKWVTVIAFLSLNFCNNPTFAQWQKVSYNELSGLQNALVKSVCSDSLGFMWLATDDGVIRFDGTNFLQLKEGLPSKYVKSVFTTSSGKTIATTDLGLIQIMTNPDYPTVKTLIKGDNYASDTLLWYPKSIVESLDKKVWVSDNHAIYKLDSSLEVLNRYQFSERDLPTNFQRSFAIFEDPVLGIYTFSEAGYLYKYDKTKDQFIEIPILMNNERINDAFFYNGKIIAATQSGVIELILDKDGIKVLSHKVVLPYISASTIKLMSNDYWIASTWSDGVYKINASKRGYKAEPLDIVKQKVVSSVFIDQSKNIWLASDNGVIYLREQYFSAPFAQETNGYIQSIQQDDDKVIFTDGKRIFFCEINTNKLIDRWMIPKQYGIVLRIIRVEDRYWFSTNIGKFLVYTLDGKLDEVIDCSNNGGAIYDVAYSSDLGFWYVQDHGGVYKLHRMKYPSSYGRDKGVTSKINTLKIINNNLYLGGSKDKGYFYQFNKESQRFENLSKPVALTRNIAIGVNDLFYDNDQFYFATNFGLAYFSGDSLVEKKVKGIDVGVVKGIVKDQKEENVYWLANSMGLIRTKNWKNNLIFDELTGLPSKTMVYRGVLLDNKGEVWVGTTSGIGVSNKVVNIKQTPQPVFTSIKNADFNFKASDVPEISKSSFLEFEFSSLSYPGNLIKYKIRYNDGDWEDLGWKNKFIVSGLKRGKYTLELKAKQTGEYLWSAPLKFTFVITERWYRTWYGILGALSILLGVFFIIFKLYDEKNQHDREVLEKLVSERTEEVKTKNKILSNRELILKKQVSKFMKVNTVLKEKQLEMQEQLNYANSLQSVVLPSVDQFKNFCSDAFILFKPKETVSGDFYWEKSFTQKNESISYYVVGDSIGHGIPGVIQSIIGVDLLNEIVNESTMKPDQILENLDQKLFEKAEKDPTMIGMDLVVLRVIRDGVTLKVEFSGAKRPLFYLEDNVLTEIKGTRRAIGNEPKHVKEKGFAVHQFILKKETILYLTTNGFYDQFNIDEKRIGISKFRSLLEKLSDINSLRNQGEWLDNYFNNWKGEIDQIDDVTIIGLRL